MNDEIKEHKLDYRLATEENTEKLNIMLQFLYDRTQENNPNINNLKAFFLGFVSEKELPQK